MTGESIKPLYIVTGATGGIGGAVAKVLAEEGKALVLACRNLDVAAEFAVQLQRETGNADITALRLDLSTFDGVRDFVAELRQMRRSVVALVNVAGAMSRRSTPNAAGIELDYQVNFLSTALLSRLVAPLMPEGGHIVFTTSVTRKVWSLPPTFPRHEHFSQLGTYGRSKLALTIFAHHLASELRGRNIFVACADPGVVNTRMISMQRWFDFLADIFFRPFISTPLQGARPLLLALKDDKTCQLHSGTTAKALKLRGAWEKRKKEIVYLIPNS